jgi:LysM repeat protein
MAKNSPADVIEAYRQRQERHFPFSLGDISKALLFLIMLAASIYVMLTGGPQLPTLIELKTNTPTLTPSITPTLSPTATITATPTTTSDLNNQCNCPSPEIMIVTVTFSTIDTAIPISSATETAIIVFKPTESLPPTETAAATETLTPTASVPPTSTQTLYTVQNRDTLGGIALRFGVTVEAIQVLNNMDGTMIYVGQVLRIPKP